MSDISLYDSQKATLFNLVKCIGMQIPWNSFNIQFYSENTGFTVDQVKDIVKEWVASGRVWIRHYPGHIHVEANPRDWRFND